MLETTVRLASYLFLAGVLTLFSSAFPSVRRRFKRAFAVGALMAIASLFVVLAGALAFR